MRSTLKFLSCLAIFAAPLAIGFPVYAQQTGSAPSQMEGPSHGGGSFEEGDGRAWNGECPERQEIREERERIRAEHEELEAEHDRLKAQCMDSKGQERSECAARKQELHARIDALHERMRALHEKVEAEPGCHREHGNTPNNASRGQWPSRQGQSNGTPGAGQ